MIYVISQIKLITELNQKFIRTGLFVVKNVGNTFLNMKIITMVELESQNNYFSRELIFKNNQIIRSLEINKLHLLGI